MADQRLPKRTRAHVLETRSRQHVESIFPTEWVCRRVGNDYGLDMRVEIVTGESVSGLEFAVQLKGTDHLRTSGEDVLHSCKVSTAHYFLHRPEPVMYVVYDAQEDTAYWLWVQPYLRGLDDASPGWRDRKEVRVRIPRANRLTREAVPLIANYVQAWWARVMAVVGQEYPASPAEAPRPFQLPPDLVTFTGREEYLDDLDGLLRPGSGQTVGLVGLHGIAGVGKSALAVQISMAEVGEAWQNSYAERLIRTIKEEEVDLSEYLDYHDAYRQLGRFLDDMYMHKRIHSSLGYLTPAEFEEQWRKEQELASN